MVGLARVGPASFSCGTASATRTVDALVVGGGTAVRRSEQIQISGLDAAKSVFPVFDGGVGPPSRKETVASAADTASATSSYAEQRRQQ